MGPEPPARLTWEQVKGMLAIHRFPFFLQLINKGKPPREPPPPPRAPLQDSPASATHRDFPPKDTRDITLKRFLHRARSS